MELLNKRYKTYFADKSFIFSILFGFVLLFASFILNFYAMVYTKETSSNAVTDIVLNNIPVYDVHAIFIYGPLVLWLFVAVLVFFEPNKIPFVLKSIALFVIIRSIFITLTHIAPFPDQITIASDPTMWINKFSSGNDLFFSAHTGLPFLMALVFWDKKYLRIIFTLTAVFFGIIVLMGHLHYSIDVLSAFFITYTIYHIACKVFKRDKAHFDHKIETVSE